MAAREIRWLAVVLGTGMMAAVLSPARTCAGPASRPHAQGERSAMDEVSPVRSPAEQPDDVELLPRPFTADQIRDEWVKGFEVTMRRWTPDGETRERWEVVAADDDAADIAFTPIDEDGKPTGEPRVEHATWAELRDHASFPADRAARKYVTLQTPLGELDGWLYSVHDPDDGKVSEYFFASKCPGAPVVMRVMEGEAAVLIMEQVARSK